MRTEVSSIMVIYGLRMGAMSTCLSLALRNCDAVVTSALGRQACQGLHCSGQCHCIALSLFATKWHAKLAACRASNHHCGAKAEASSSDLTSSASPYLPNLTMEILQLQQENQQFVTKQICNM